MKRKDVVESKFSISVNYSFSVIKIAVMRTYQVCKYMFIWVLVYWTLSVPSVCVCVCVCVCVREISNQSTSKKTCVRLQGPSGTEVPKPNICISIISLSKIAHQMWHNHPFSQRNKRTEKPVVVGVGGNLTVWSYWSYWELEQEIL